MRQDEHSARWPPLGINFWSFGDIDLMYAMIYVEKTSPLELEVLELEAIAGIRVEGAGVRGLSVIIPSRNETNLKACVKALWSCEPGIRFIVVDEGWRFRGLRV